MNFATVKYLIFFVVVFLIYWRLKRKQQNFFLLIASYYFYASWDWRFLSLIIISSVVDYITGAQIYKAEGLRRKKFWMSVSLVVNLGVLGYFKYFNFFIDSFYQLASQLGVSVSHSNLNIILPVGISFYTFQTLSYSLDIYRGELKPIDSFIDFGAFVAFFPQLVAGPIVRAREFLYQLGEKRQFDGSKLEAGITRFLFGYFKKIFIADTLGVFLVDPIFAHPENYTSMMLWLGVIGYAVQIYADFSGYSSMAIGSAKMLGFEIPENFNFPYLAKNFSDFWRRWNMTMSRFFRDYVYIELGGNRHGFPKTLRNLAATTLISGLWHGAGWTFVIWGGLHGVFITINQLWRRWKKERVLLKWLPSSLKYFSAWFITQFAILITWILFRSPDFSTASTYLTGLFVSPGSEILQLPVWVGIAFAGFLIDHFSGWLLENNPQIKFQIPTLAKATVYAGIIIFLFHSQIEGVSPFIYFQF